MADEKEEKFSTYAVKLDGEVKQELLGLLEGYKDTTGATTAGDFIKTLLEVYKTNKIVGNVTGTDSDIKALNQCTTQMFSIFNSMIQKNDRNNSTLQGEFSEQLVQKDNTINNLKAKNEEINLSYEALQGAYNNICEEKNKLQDTNKQLQKLNDSLDLNNSKLIEETNGLHELKVVNQQLFKDAEALRADVAVKNNIIAEKDKVIDEFSKEIEALTLSNLEKVESLEGKFDLILQKSLLDLQKKHQGTMEAQQAKYNLEIQEYQASYKRLLGELEAVRSIPKTKVVKKNNILTEKDGE